MARVGVREEDAAPAPPLAQLVGAAWSRAGAARRGALTRLPLRRFLAAAGAAHALCAPHADALAARFAACDTSAAAAAAAAPEDDEELLLRVRNGTVAPCAELLAVGNSDNGDGGSGDALVHTLSAVGLLSDKEASSDEDDDRDDVEVGCASEEAARERARPGVRGSAAESASASGSAAPLRRRRCGACALREPFDPAQLGRFAETAALGVWARRLRAWALSSGDDDEDDASESDDEIGRVSVAGGAATAAAASSARSDGARASRRAARTRRRAARAAARHAPRSDGDSDDSDETDEDTDEGTRGLIYNSMGDMGDMETYHEVWYQPHRSYTHHAHTFSLSCSADVARPHTPPRRRVPHLC
jgi:hypothetical protein